MRIPKYGGQNLANLWSLWTAFTCCCSLSWLPIWLPSVVVDPCFIHCRIFTKNSFCCVERVADNSLNRRHVVIFDRLWVNTATTLNTAFSLTNNSCKMVNTLPSNIFSSSFVSHNFNLRSVKTSLRRFFLCFPGQLLKLSELSVQQHLYLNDRV